MKFVRYCLLAIGAASLPTQLIAEEATPNLPPTELVARSLRAAPAVQATASDLEAAVAQRQALEAGHYEWNARIGSQQRTTRPPLGSEQRYKEWSAALERPLRLPGKSRLDGELGAQGVALAETARGDMLHESSRQLLQLWFTWLKETVSTRQWASLHELLDKQSQGIQRRQQLGDAARLDSVQASAAQAQARAQWLQAKVREQSASEELHRRFPLLPLIPPDSIATPQAISGTAESWINAIMKHSHELQMARGEAQRAQLIAQRQSQDRTPDPTFGLQVSNERGGEERVVGAYLAIPLPGEGRRATADAGRAHAAAASRREAAVEQRISAEAAMLYHNAQAAYGTWQAGQTAADNLEQAATMTARAYQLGEGSLSELLLARRQANEAQLAARLLQLEALELHYRLLLDAHQLWDFDD